MGYNHIEIPVEEGAIVKHRQFNSMQTRATYKRLIATVQIRYGLAPLSSALLAPIYGTIPRGSGFQGGRHSA